jgi:hypothetical protein
MRQCKAKVIDFMLLSYELSFSESSAQGIVRETTEARQ